MYLILKRLLDLFIALVALILLSPIFIVVIPVLLLTGEHEVFYRQDRIGFKNRHFEILKFATMLKNSPNLGTGSITVRNDPRVLPFGKFLRLTKINELPQIFNVLRGDMSIVGPRPLMKVSFDQYTPEVQEKIYQSKPGITGIGSVVFRDEEALVSATKMDKAEFYKKVIFPYKGVLELWYNQNRSIYTDLWIIVLTAWVIIFPKSDLHFRVFKTLPKSA